MTSSNLIYPSDFLKAHLQIPLLYKFSNEVFDTRSLGAHMQMLEDFVVK